jgi:DNA-binding MarR family transcriptional regulator
VPNQKDRKSKNNLDECYKVVQQSGTGIRAVEIAEKIGVDRTTVHRHLRSLELRGKVENRSGLWSAKTTEQTIKPMEKEIVIRLPLPKDQLRQTALLEAQAKEFERKGLVRTAEDMRIFLEKLRETRTITITGKNVNDLDLEKIGNMIQQANEKSSKVSLRGLFKSLKRSRTNNSKRQ